MESQLLRAFVAIVDQGSFSGAAEKLHLTQPAVSKRLATLESHLGQLLIERGQRRPVVTDAGRTLLPFARRILDESHNAQMALAGAHLEPGGELSVITSHHIGLHHLPRWLKVYTQRYPVVELNLKFMESERGFEALRSREAELAFVTLNDTLVEQFEIYHRWADPMRFVVAPDHPLAKTNPCRLKDLAGHRAILPAPFTATYQRVSQLFMQQGLPLNAQMPTNYLETIKMMTSVGLGWSILPLTMVDEHLVVVPVEEAPTRDLGAVGLRNRQLGVSAQALIDVAREGAAG
ncbi:LysR family transcriptional regulator [Hydrocarboniclastica marina]|uniref:LysR family transcriptional regulator n=1 Tax=Hydrocarboniclastica marina TaxID=2259620 RepID=A0A4P7XI77_9ALTE|nr:LysR family transcriptional regulator [Hydrocarboniclastica marina]QCF26214.1 LysR family transcriptional regulator [Hydrocarboniclastica marina]